MTDHFNPQFDEPSNNFVEHIHMLKNNYESKVAELDAIRGLNEVEALEMIIDLLQLFSQTNTSLHPTNAFYEGSDDIDSDDSRAYSMYPWYAALTDLCSSIEYWSYSLNEGGLPQDIIASEEDMRKLGIINNEMSFSAKLSMADYQSIQELGIAGALSEEIINLVTLYTLDIEELDELTNIIEQKGTDEKTAPLLYLQSLKEVFDLFKRLQNQKES